DGTFEDVTKKIGLEHVGHSQAAFFFDYDNDGFLDLLLIQTAAWTLDQKDENGDYFVGKGDPGSGGLLSVASSAKEYNILYHNEPDGSGGRRFVEVKDSGLEGKGWAADAAIFDYNDDGRLDVLITSMFGPSQLYRNEGKDKDDKVKFTEVTKEVLRR